MKPGRAASHDNAAGPRGQSTRCTRTDHHICSIGAHDHTHHGRAWAALDAVGAGARWLLFALFLIAAIVGAWSLFTVAVLGATGSLP